MISIDAGDFTGDPTPPGQKQTDAIVEGMNQMGYRVAGFSQRELAQGWDAFQARRTRAKFPFVSANIVWQDTGEPVVDPFVVVKIPLRKGAKSRDTRLAFTALTVNNPSFLKNGAGQRRIVTVDPVTAAAKYVPQMRAKADIVVVLSSMDLEVARNVARKVKEIDLILGASGPAQSRADDFPEDSLIGRTRLQALGDQGKTLGDVRVMVDDRGGVASVQRVVVGLTREWPDDPTLAQLMTTTREAVNEYNRSLAEAQNPFAAPAPAGAAAGAPGAAAAPAAGPPVYTGAERCQACHAEAYATWSRSKHAHAFDILVKSSQNYNPKCVGCHTMGYGKPQGFVSATATPGLEHVGCEGCHGPSSQHPDTVGKGYGATSVERCRDCHTSENSPDYVPSTYIPQIKHWGDAKTSP
ncbi:MAG TPA: multiheme c-type cytochrome [Patescibacteria group bacterium]|nr:multiheme c-type cytochrome [Patescibacteria group bacterium]